MASSRRKPGLWFSTTKVEVEPIKDRRKRKECAKCGEVPAERRLMVTQGTGQNQKVKVFCIPCGVLWLKDKKEESARAMEYLRTGEGECRLPKEELRCQE